jgi:hypothetical protein
VYRTHQMEKEESVGERSVPSAPRRTQGHLISDITENSTVNTGIQIYKRRGMGISEQNEKGVHKESTRQEKWRK